MVSHTSKNCILFCGAPGNGKTTMMNAFADVIEIFANRGYWENFNTKMNIFDAVDLCQFDSKDLLEISNRYIIGIEDMGREPTDTVTFGDICSPISRLLERRYERQLPTIISANLTPAQIRDKYGNRIADRFNEMTAIINFKDASYRGRSQPLTAPGSGSATETETKTSTGRKA